MFAWRTIGVFDWVLSKPLSMKLFGFCKVSGKAIDLLGENKTDVCLNDAAVL